MLSLRDHTRLATRGAVDSGRLTQADPLHLSPGPPFLWLPGGLKQPGPGSFLSHHISGEPKPPCLASLLWLLLSWALPCFTVPNFNKCTFKTKKPTHAKQLQPLWNKKGSSGMWTNPLRISWSTLVRQLVRYNPCSAHLPPSGPYLKQSFLSFC